MFALSLVNHEGSIRNLGNVGHIEDIAVLEDQQGKKLGLYILRALGYIAEKVGCYKVNGSTRPLCSSAHQTGLSCFFAHPVPTGNHK